MGRNVTLLVLGLLPIIVWAGLVGVNIFWATSLVPFGGIGGVFQAVVTLLTYLYVIATVWMVRTMSRAREEEARPRVLVDFEFKHVATLRTALWTVVIRNIGHTPAFDVEVRFEPSLPSDQHPEQPFLEEPIAFMAPGSAVAEALGLPPLTILRTLLAQEPVVCLRPL